MNDWRPRALAAMLALTALGAGLGWLAGPALSRTHYVVRAAEQLAIDEAGERPERALSTDAIRRLAIPSAQVYREAREARGRFRVGGALFGLWCGLAAGMKLISILGERRRVEYEAHPAHCLACGRCHIACPVERERLAGRTL